jgi:NlpC/P60 family
MRKSLFFIVSCGIAAFFASGTAAFAQASRDDKPAEASLFSSAVDRAGDLVIGALTHLGIRYKYGGNTPESGFDCSGFVRHVYQNTVGLLLPRSAADMAAKGSEVDKSELKPGDLVFFNTLKRTFSHVGIYIGEGKFVHAPSSGGQVRVESMSLPYWQTRFNGARRMDAALVSTTPEKQYVSTGSAQTLEAKASRVSIPAPTSLSSPADPLAAMLTDLRNANAASNAATGSPPGAR